MTPSEGSIVYVSSARLPSRMANGVQTLQMCDALAEVGWPVTLYHFPQTAPELRGRGVAEFYQVRNDVAVRTFGRRGNPLPRDFSAERVMGLPFVASAFLWASWTARSLARERAALYLTREPVIAWALTRAGLPTLVEFHDLPSPMLRPASRGALGRRSVRGIVALTGGLADDLHRDLGVPRERIRVLHDGVDLRRYPASRTRDEARAKLGLAGETPLVVYTGQLFPHKGAGTLVRAAAEVPEARFVLVGGLDASLRELQAFLYAERISNVTLTGPVEPGLVPLYQAAADVLVLPNSAQNAHSARYSSPMKLFEYMAADRPIVASAVPCVQEILEHGRTGWLVPADRPDELAAGIRAVLASSELGRALGAGARALVEGFTWQERALRVLDAAQLVY